MPRSNDVVIQGESSDRMLNFGAVRIHNRHLQEKLPSSISCPVCGEGLEGVMAPLGPRNAPAEVVEGNGTDEEEDPAFPPSGRNDY